MLIDTSALLSSQSADCLFLVPMSVNIVCISFKNSLQFLRSSVIICFNSLTTIRWCWRSWCKIFISFRTSIWLLEQKACFVFWISFPVMPKRDRILPFNRTSLWWKMMMMMHSFQQRIACLVFGNVCIDEYWGHTIRCHPCAPKKLHTPSSSLSRIVCSNHLTMERVHVKRMHKTKST